MQFISYPPTPALFVSVEYVMDEMERRSIVDEPVRKCPIPAPRTSVPSPFASPSLRHKSEYKHIQRGRYCTTLIV